MDTINNAQDGKPALNMISLGNNRVLLDGVELKGVRDLKMKNLEISAPQIYELELKMDVYG